jgi:phytoene dehydrogenase-like protein
MTSTPRPIVVIGGGIAGLVSAAIAARAGAPVVMLEKASALGGRAATRQKNGFSFNLGPHALYRRGVLNQTLSQLGVAVSGAVPGGNGAFALARGRLHTLPVGFASLLTTGLLGIAGRIEFARLLSRLPAVDPAPLQHQTVAAWLDASIHDPTVRQLIEMLVRVTTFTNDPHRQSAGAAIEQLQLSLSGVLYLDGGWQTIVDGLRRVAVDAGARVMSPAPVVSLETRDRRNVHGVRLSDGTVVPASAVIITGAPDEVRQLTGTQYPDVGPAVRVATLDVGLRTLPKPRRTVAFGLETPLYFSVHSSVARLAPEGGALIHASMYLHPSENAGADVERELNALMDMMQPGWRELVESKRFLPNVTVTHAQLTAATGGLAGRPAPRVEQFENVFIAGDWVGPRGQLSDAAAASAAEAAQAALESCRAWPSGRAYVADRALSDIASEVGAA